VLVVVVQRRGNFLLVSRGNKLTRTGQRP
jgi:hypothetical protein